MDVMLSIHRDAVNENRREVETDRTELQREAVRLEARVDKLTAQLEERDKVQERDSGWKMISFLHPPTYQPTHLCTCSLHLPYTD